MNVEARLGLVTLACALLIGIVATITDLSSQAAYAQQRDATGKLLAEELDRVTERLPRWWRNRPQPGASLTPSLIAADLWQQVPTDAWNQPIAVTWLSDSDGIVLVAWSGGPHVASTPPLAEAGRLPPPLLQQRRLSWNDLQAAIGLAP